eukprot:scaffold37532_cov33-Tisochrysis_lutea.AAC.3
MDAVQLCSHVELGDPKVGVRKRVTLRSGASKGRPLTMWGPQEYKQASIPSFRGGERSAKEPQ